MRPNLKLNFNLLKWNLHIWEVSFLKKTETILLITTAALLSFKNILKQWTKI